MLLIGTAGFVQAQTAGVAINADASTAQVSWGKFHGITSKHTGVFYILHDAGRYLHRHRTGGVFDGLYYE